MRIQFFPGSTLFAMFFANLNDPIFKSSNARAKGGGGGGGMLKFRVDWRINTWYLGIYSVFKFHAMFSLKLLFARATVPTLVFSHSFLVANDPLYQVGLEENNILTSALRS